MRPDAPRAPLAFARLTAADAPALARLERALRGAPAAPAAAGLGQALRAGSGEALGLGLLHAGCLVGAVVAQLAPSALPGAAGAVLRISHAVLLPAYRRHLRELLGRAADLARAAHPARALEVRAPQGERERARWRAVWSARAVPLGYRLAREERVLAPGADVPESWLRWEPAPLADGDPRSLPVWASLELGGVEYQVRAARSELDWARLEPWWDALLRETEGASGFQSYAYLRVWWRQFGQHRRLWILGLWCGSELVGIAPLQLTATRGLAGSRVELGFLGTRVNADRASCGEVHRPSLLCSPRHAARAAELLLACLSAPEAPWDRLDLYGQAPASPLSLALREWARLAGHLVRSERASSSPYLVPDRPFEQYFAERSEKFRANVRSAHRKLAARGELRLEHHREGPALLEAFARYLELEQRGWKSGGGAAVGAPGRREYYEALCAALGPKGGVQIASLSLDGRWIAARIALVHEAHVSALEITHDDELAKLSPGTVLEYLVLQDCFASGCTEYDLMGGFIAHKLRWTSSVRDTQRFYVDRATLVTRLQYLWLLQLRPRLLRWLEQRGWRAAALRAHEQLRARLQQLLNPRSAS